MKGNKKFWLMGMALVLATLLCTGLTGCPTPNAAESKAYVGTYVADNGTTTIVIKADGTSTWSLTQGDDTYSGSGTYTITSDTTATVSYTSGTPDGAPTGTLTATTADNWATITTSSDVSGFNGLTLTKK